MIIFLTVILIIKHNIITYFWLLLNKSSNLTEEEDFLKYLAQLLNIEETYESSLESFRAYIG